MSEGGMVFLIALDSITRNIMFLGGFNCLRVRCGGINHSIQSGSPHKKLSLTFLFLVVLVSVKYPPLYTNNTPEIYLRLLYKFYSDNMINGDLISIFFYTFLTYI